MANLTLTSPRTVVNGLIKLGLIGLLGVSVYSAPKILHMKNELKLYGARMEQIKSVVEKGNSSEGQALLDKYGQEKVLEKADEILLKTIIDKKRGEEGAANLNKFIAAGEYDQAKELYSQLKKEFAIDPTSDSNWNNQITSISLEGLISSLKTKSGEERIKAIDLITSKYPNSPRAKNLDQERNKEVNSLAQTLMTSTKPGEEKINSLEVFCNTYQNCPLITQVRTVEAQEFNALANSYLDSQADRSKIVNIFDSLIAWTSGKDKEIVSQINLKEIYEKGKNYLAKQEGEEAGKDIQIGDRVKVVKFLGKLAGKSENQAYLGWSGFPLGTPGTVTGEWFPASKDPNDTHAYKVVLDGCTWKDGSQPYFLPRELKRIGDEEITKISGQLETIKKIYEAK